MLLFIGLVFSVGVQFLAVSLADEQLKINQNDVAEVNAGNKLRRVGRRRKEGRRRRRKGFQKDKDGGDQNERDDYEDSNLKDKVEENNSDNEPSEKNEEYEGHEKEQHDDHDEEIETSDREDDHDDHDDHGGDYEHDHHSFVGDYEDGDHDDYNEEHTLGEVEAAAVIFLALFILFCLWGVYLQCAAYATRSSRVGVSMGDIELSTVNQRRAAKAVSMPGIQRNDIGVPNRYNPHPPVRSFHTASKEDNNLHILLSEVSTLPVRKTIISLAFSPGCPMSTLHGTTSIDQLHSIEIQQPI